MALSNILNEPRREITETIIGVVIVGVCLSGFLMLDYHFAVWLNSVTSPHGVPVALGMTIVGPLGTIICCLSIASFAFFAHFVGEE